MRKSFIGIIVAIFCALFIIAPAMAADTPAPLCNADGTYISEATYVAGKMDPALDLHLLSAAHGWRPGPGNLMTKMTDDGTIFYHSDLVIPKGGLYHPAQIKDGKIHYLEIQHAHSNWQLEDFVAEPCTYINPL